MLPAPEYSIKIPYLLSFPESPLHFSRLIATPTQSFDVLNGALTWTLIQAGAFLKNA